MLQDATRVSRSTHPDVGAALPRLAPTEGNSRFDAVDRWVFRAMLAALGLAPFWFGSNTLLAWGLNACAWCTLAAAYEISLVLRARPHPVALQAIRLPALLFAAVCLWILVQTASWTPEPWHHPIWRTVSDALGRELPGSISVNPDASLLALVRLLTAAAAFWLALQLCRDPNNARSLVNAIAAIGAAYAIYGVIAFVFFPDSILWFDKVHYRDSVTSTFINRNSYATYAGLGLVAAVGGLSSAYGRALGSRGGPARFRLARLIEASAGPAGLLLLAAFVIAVALMLTSSRAGIVASLAGVMMLGLLSGARGRRRGGSALALILVVVVLAAALLGFGEAFLGRLESVDSQYGDRLAVSVLTLRSVLDAPLLGFGHGTFSDVFPMYRDASIGPWGVWDKAHNTYAELLQGLGIPAAVAFALSVGLLVVRAGRAAVERVRQATGPLVAAAATVAVLLHAFVDFSLQMQAVALTWSALLGLGVAQSWSSRVATEG